MKGESLGLVLSAPVGKSTTVRIEKSGPWGPHEIGTTIKMLQLQLECIAAGTEDNERERAPTPRRPRLAASAEPEASVG